MRPSIVISALVWCPALAASGLSAALRAAVSKRDTGR